MSDDSGRALEAVLKLAALEERSAALKTQLERIEGQLTRLLDRLSRLEGGNGTRHLVGPPAEEPTDALSAAHGDQPEPRPFLTSYSEE